MKMITNKGSSPRVQEVVSVVPTIVGCGAEALCAANTAAAAMTSAAGSANSTALLGIVAVAVSVSAVTQSHWRPTRRCGLGSGRPVLVGVPVNDGRDCIFRPSSHGFAI
jgi:hypothetical protein